MKHILAAVIVSLSVTIAGVAMAQSKATKTATYERLSDADRRIVSAIYESQLDSRRDRAGHPLLSKDQITAMRRGSTWAQLFERLSIQGYVAFDTLKQALVSYNQEMPARNRPLIISTAAGEQIVIPRHAASRGSSPAPDPARANIIPTPPVRRAYIKTVELAPLGAGGAGLETSTDSRLGGAAINAASAAQTR